MRGWSRHPDEAAWDCPFCGESWCVRFEGRPRSDQKWAVCTYCGLFEGSIPGRGRAVGELWREWIERVLAECQEGGYVLRGLMYEVARQLLERDNPELFSDEEGRAENIADKVLELWPDESED